MRKALGSPETLQTPEGASASRAGRSGFEKGRFWQIELDTFCYGRLKHFSGGPCKEPSQLQRSMRSPLPMVALFYAGGVLLGHWLPLGLWWLIAMGFSTAALCLISNPLRRCALALLLVLVAWADTVG